MLRLWAWFSPRTPALPAKQPAAWPRGYLHRGSEAAPAGDWVIDNLIGRQEAADQVLPRRGLGAVRRGLKGAGMFGGSNEPLFALAAPRPPWGRPHKGFLFGLEDSLSKNCPSKN